jgi:hypothetical protein
VRHATSSALHMRTFSKSEIYECKECRAMAGCR